MCVIRVVVFYGACFALVLYVILSFCVSVSFALVKSFIRMRCSVLPFSLQLVVVRLGLFECSCCRLTLWTIGHCWDPCR